MQPNDKEELIPNKEVDILFWEPTTEEKLKQKFDNAGMAVWNGKSKKAFEKLKNYLLQEENRGKFNKMLTIGTGSMHAITQSPKREDCGEQSDEEDALPPPPFLNQEAVELYPGLNQKQKAEVGIEFQIEKRTRKYGRKRPLQSHLTKNQ